ncbi:MAG TPA: putative zinc-binding protein [Candidatus Lokiarchaeia archaeon]
MSKNDRKKENIVLIPCSGAEYNGELARQVAIRLKENSQVSSISSMHCSTIFLKNILLKKEQLVEITKNHLKSSFLVIIDGCKTSCANSIFQFLEIKPDLLVHVDDFVPKERTNLNDIEAFKNRPQLCKIKEEDIKKIADCVMTQLKERGFDIE